MVFRTNNNNGSLNGSFGMAPKNPRESTINAHDWVWLGRATLERAAAHTSGRTLPVTSGGDIRITENPLITEELDSSLTSSKQIEFPTAGVVDTSTYSKSSNRLQHMNTEDYFQRLYHK